MPLDPVDPAQCWSHLYLKSFSDAVMRTAIEVRMYCTSSAHDRIMHFKTSEQVTSSSTTIPPYPLVNSKIHSNAHWTLSCTERLHTLPNHHTYTHTHPNTHARTLAGRTWPCEERCLPVESAFVVEPGGDSLENLSSSSTRPRQWGLLYGLFRSCAIRV